MNMANTGMKRCRRSVLAGDLQVKTVGYILHLSDEQKRKRFVNSYVGECMENNCFYTLGERVYV